MRPCFLISVSSVRSVVFKNLFLTYFGIDALVSVFVYKEFGVTAHANELIGIYGIATDAIPP
jgi:hypothetical protein